MRSAGAEMGTDVRCEGKRAELKPEGEGKGGAECWLSNACK